MLETIGSMLNHEWKYSAATTRGVQLAEPVAAQR
jgi:hypothetical protein